jgi:uncharacterized protein (TIGR03790 family)
MSLRRLTIFPALVLLAVHFAAAAASAAGLAPDNLLLITNRNVPEGRKLADYYADKRKVPENRVLELDLPTGDEVSFADYEAKVVPVVREFLARHKLRERVTCLVTFYGVPLRVGNRVNTPADEAEVAGLQQQLAAAVTGIARAVEGIEAVAREVDPAFKASGERSLSALLMRDRAARGVVSAHAMKIADPKAFDAFMSKSEQIVAPLEGPAKLAERQMMGIGRLGNQMTAAQLKEAEGIRDRLLALRDRLEELQARRGDPTARQQLRDAAREQLGLIEFARLLDGMIEYFATEGTAAAFDSDLALVEWNYYPRRRFVPNPFHYKTGSPRPNPQAFMVTRLDAPQPGIVQTMILASLKAEAEGLAGRVVIDAGGNLSIDPKSAAYASFDQTLRNLGETVATRTTLRPPILDTNREVLPANSGIRDVAIYCGWYALQNYTPSCSFVPGAVGYHVASFELTTLHQPSRQWCYGLLNDGVAATLGPVAEPYLTAFPPPDEFFGLLFTGKLTLAEVYWRTVPNASWMITMIGDPLYTPFKAKPAMELESLPEALRSATRPASAATTQGVR